MSFYDGVDYISRASMLVRQLIDRHDSKYGVGSMTCSIYDTAWVAMIAKTEDGQTRYLFPSSFHYLLKTQQPDGGWGGQRFSSEVDCVLNSLAALLAICRHISRPYQLREMLTDLEHRKDRAIYFLETKFSEWDVNSTATNTSLQPLVTKLLQMLEQECVRFAFPGREHFLQTKPNKRSRSILAALYGTGRTMLTHSLEGRVGEIDFDRVRQHKIYGSMMASPASTAAYLMNCSVWDDEAEAYLNHVVSGSAKRSFGGVPAKFPTSVFELSGVISTLLGNGFSPRELGIKTLNTAADFLQDCLQLDSGVAGFVPYVESDADNSAKTISALALLGRSSSPQGLLSRYETLEYFKTYIQDPNPSFGTNCHVLKALLDLVPENSEQMLQIEKIVTFLCNYWWTTNGWIEDQSNRSPNYPIMLMVDAFILLIQLWAGGCVPVPHDPLVRDKVYICLFQALIRTLQTQKANGSWGAGGCETAAYAIIALSRLCSMTSAPRLRLQLNRAIKNGRKFLSKDFKPFSDADLMWSGKITTGSSVLYQAYVIAALQAPLSKQSGPTIESHFEISLAQVMVQTKYYAKQAWFPDVPEWLIQACLLESRLFLPQIRNMRYAVFPIDTIGEDRHFESIPFAWVVASSLDNRAIGAEHVIQMTVLSILGRQLEDYMQIVVRDTFAGCLFEVEDIIHGIFQELELYSKDQCFCGDCGNERSSTATSISDVRSVFYRLITQIINHPYVLMASERDQAQLKAELLAFLLHSVNELSGRDASPATEQTSHPYTFAFLGCLVGNQGSYGGVGLRRDFLNTPEQQYLAADLCRHMSIISFILRNAESQQCSQPARLKSRSISFGSIGRLSRSVSSASTASSSYAEESSPPISPISSASSMSHCSPRNASFSKWLEELPQNSSGISCPETQQMTRLLDHERRCLGICLDSIEEAGINRRTGNIIRLFVDATEVSEQIYSDPNIGSYYQPTSANEVIDLACMEQNCVVNAPPVPPKKRRGSVANARAALTISPLAPKKLTFPHNTFDQQHRQPSPQQPQPASKQIHKLKPFWADSQPPTPMAPQNSKQIHLEISRQISDQIPQHTKQQASRNQSFTQGSERTLTPSQDKGASPVPVGRDWSWNRKSAFPVRCSSRASSEISRIERIMNDIDGGKLQTKSMTDMQSSTAEESSARFSSNPHIDTQVLLTSFDSADAETIKLAKARMQMQKHLNHEAQRQAIDSRKRLLAERQKKMPSGLQSKSMIDVSKQEVKRRATYPEDGGWIKAAAAVEMPLRAAQTNKLHRASRLGGPKWKAPF